MACSVCKKPSHFIYRITKESGIEYCDKCLPNFLDARKRANLLEKTEDYKAIVEEGLKNILQSSDEPAEEKPKPKKKAAKKKAE